MKKLLCLLIFICCTAAAFAQNVKPYSIDLNKMPVVNDDKTATFDKVTKTITVIPNSKLQWGGDKGIYLVLNNCDIGDYNIVRIKYKAIGDYGFNFVLDYNDNSLDWTKDKTTYCPAYLNEMIIPLKSNQNKLNGIQFEGHEHVPFVKFSIESVTFEKVAKPVKTDLFANDEPPVIDTASYGEFDGTISAWDFVKKLGVGYQYSPFLVYDAVVDRGMDFYLSWGYKKPSKEEIHFIKEKGFKLLRLQTSPGTHIMDENYTIDSRFIKLLKQVVDWAIEEDMYVIVCGPLNEWLEKDENFKKKVEESFHYDTYDFDDAYIQKSKNFLKAFWKQYAEAFNNSYDEHLIFETLNEPLHNFHEHNWEPRTDCSVCRKDYAVMNEYNQLIVDTIRSTGGNNVKRFIMVEGLTGQWKYMSNELFKIPKDKTKDRLIPTLHYYPMGSSPGYFAKFYKESIKEEVTEAFETLDKMYFSKHIPVYISETGHSRFIPVLERIAAIKDFMAEVTDSNRSCNVTMHDNNDVNAENDFYGYYDNRYPKWNDSEYLDSLIYAAEGKDFQIDLDFIKKNEAKYESIVGKNLLNEPLQRKNWEDDNARIDPDVFYRSTPVKYKIEFNIEKNGSKPILQFAFIDQHGNWRELQKEKNVKISGGAVGNNYNNIEVRSNIITVSINEKLSKEFETAIGIYVKGQDIIIKSMKVVE